MLKHLTSSLENILEEVSASQIESSIVGARDETRFLSKSLFLPQSCSRWVRILFFFYTRIESSIVDAPDGTRFFQIAVSTLSKFCSRRVRILFFTPAKKVVSEMDPWVDNVSMAKPRHTRGSPHLVWFIIWVIFVYNFSRKTYTLPKMKCQLLAVLTEIVLSSLLYS